MGDLLQYRQYQRNQRSREENETLWLKLCEGTHYQFCACGDWRLHLQHLIFKEHPSQWSILGATKSGESQNTVRGSTGSVESDIELAAAAAAVEVDLDVAEGDVQQ